MQPIPVTGGAGFVGAHTCQELAADGLHPIAFDNLSWGHRDAIERFIDFEAC
jgi:UDP-arabinose 4-epimerase